MAEINNDRIFNENIIQVTDNISTADIYWGADRIHPLEKFYKEKLTPILVDTLQKVKPINYNICNFVSRGIDQNN